jgi:hypothetical protein
MATLLPNPSPIPIILKIRPAGNENTYALPGATNPTYAIMLQTQMDRFFCQDLDFQILIKYSKRSSCLTSA